MNLKKVFGPFGDFINYKPKHQIDEKIFRQDKKFSTKLPHGNRKMRKLYFSMMNTKYKTTEEMIRKSLKGKTKGNTIKLYVINMIN